MNYLILVFSFLWAPFLFYTYKGQKHLKSIDTADDIVAGDCPLISIIIAVKDGSKDLEKTLNHLLNIGYSRLEVIVANDRSIDNTEEIINYFKKKSNIIQSINIKELPLGWLGKVHALDQAVKLATGDFLLFIDSDIQISKNVLETSISLCEHLKLDHLALLPRTKPGDFWLNLMMSTSMLLFTLSARLWLPIGKRPLSNIKGVGAFNLVRKSTFDKTEGFNWLKMDVADDVALAQLIVKNGGISHLMKASNEGPRLDWYKNFKELVTGLEKNIVGGFTNYRPSLIFAISSISILAFTMPLMGWKNWLGFLVPILSVLIFAIYTKKYSNYSLLVLFSFPLGIALLGCILLRSAYICFRQSGIKWSGTFYSLEDLKKGSKVKLGL